MRKGLLAGAYFLLLIIVQPVLRVEWPLLFAGLLALSIAAGWWRCRRKESPTGRVGSRRFAIWNSIIAGLLLLFTLLSPSERSLLREIDAHLDRRAARPASSIGAFEIIAYSNMAEAFTGLAVENPDRTEEMIDRLETILGILRREDDRYLEHYGDFPREGVRLGHLNIILGAYNRLNPGSDLAERNQAISAFLARTTLNEPDVHMYSYTAMNTRWPSDQAAILYSLWLCDQNYGTRISREPIRRWMEYVGRRVSDDRGLHRSEVPGPGSTARGKHPRGCALSWSVRYLSDFLPEEAERLYEAYRRDFWIDGVYFGGFREYPPGIHFPGDVDSGPIIPVLDLGVAATAFGVGAARRQRDWWTYYQILNTQHIVDACLTIVRPQWLIPIGVGLGLVSPNDAAGLRKSLDDFTMLAASIALNQRTTRAWYGVD